MVTLSCCISNNSGNENISNQKEAHSKETIIKDELSLISVDDVWDNVIDSMMTIGAEIMSVGFYKSQINDIILTARQVSASPSIRKLLQSPDTHEVYFFIWRTEYNTSKSRFIFWKGSEKNRVYTYFCLPANGSDKSDANVVKLYYDWYSPSYIDTIIEKCNVWDKNFLHHNSIAEVANPFYLTEFRITLDVTNGFTMDYSFCFYPATIEDVITEQTTVY